MPGLVNEPEALIQKKRGLLSPCLGAGMGGKKSFRGGERACVLATAEAGPRVTASPGCALGGNTHACGSGVVWGVLLRRRSEYHAAARRSGRGVPESQVGPSAAVGQALWGTVGVTGTGGC